MNKTLLRQCIISFTILTALYLVVFLFIQRSAPLLSFKQVYPLLPTLLITSAINYLIRFVRYYYLIRKTENIPFKACFFAYLSGFALTATPAKAGELIRIRYMAHLGVPRHKTISLFVFERTCDVIAVVLLSLFLLHLAPWQLTVLATLFICLFFVVIALFLFNHACWHALILFSEKHAFNKLNAFIRYIVRIQTACQQWINLKDISFSLLSGILAWLFIAYSFIYTVHHIAPQTSNTDWRILSVYPFSMLISAASMIPGGVGSAETATTFLLIQFHTPLLVAIFIAVFFRMFSLGFSIVIGTIPLIWLEIRHLLKNNVV